MQNNYLGILSCSVGAITTLYGAYSYYTAPAKSQKQREKAKIIMAAGVGLLAAGIALSYYSQQSTPEYLQSYVRELKGRVVPQAEGPIKEFPKNLYRFRHPGFYALNNGDMCKLPSADAEPPFDQCPAYVKALVNSFKSRHSNFQSLVEGHEFRFGKGYPIKNAFSSGGFTEITTGMDPRIITNYKKSLETAEKLFLQNEDPNSTLESIKKIHEVMMKGVLHQNPGIEMKGGILRTEAMIIGDDEMEFTFAGLKKKLKEVGGTLADHQNLSSWIEKLSKYGTIEAADPHLKDAERAVLRKIVFVPTSAADLPKAMLQFAKRFQEILQLVKDRFLHPVPGAAWVHQSCTENHPFGDGNGGLCRTLMNLVLQKGGIKAIAIPNDDIYTAAIKANDKLPGSFVNYLLKMILWNRNQKIL
jgi:hypothetical protein